MNVKEFMGCAAMMALIAAMLWPQEGHASTCRSAAVKHQFDKQQGYPHGKDGYVVDHICPLEQGGLDAAINMQYQNIVDGHKKDRIELTPAGKIQFCNKNNSTPTRQVFNCK